MSRLSRALIALALVLSPSLAAAQTVGSSVVFPAGYAPGVAICIKQADGTCPPVTATSPLPSASVPKVASSTSTGGSIASANVFQSALAASAARLGCTIQNTSTAAMLVYVGPVGSASTAASLQIQPGGTFGCLVGNVVLTDPISVASASAGATYVVVAQ